MTSSTRFRMIANPVIFFGSFLAAELVIPGPSQAPLWRAVLIRLVIVARSACASAEMLRLMRSLSLRRRAAAAGAPLKSLTKHRVY